MLRIREWGRWGISRISRISSRKDFNDDEEESKLGRNREEEKK
jgi:hypothetical protein